MKDIIKVMDSSWESYAPIHFEYTRTEVNPTLNPIIGLDETVVIVDLKLQFTNLSGRMSICLPGEMLSNVFTEISRESPLRRVAAEDKSDEIFDSLRDSSLEIVAELAREKEILTVGVVTKPFGFEGRRRMQQAEGGIEELRTKVDSLVIIPNERLKHATDQKITFANAFEIADDVLRQAVQSISDLIRDTGFINLDFADVTAVMKNAGLAHMGVGRAAGKGKAEEAAKMAISSPLLETSINGARGILINVAGSPDIGLEEIDQAANLVQSAVHPDANVIFGATFDETLDDEIRVTVIATGFDKEPGQLPGTAETPTEEPEKTAGSPELKPLTEEDIPKEEDPYDVIFKIFNKRD